MKMSRFKVAVLALLAATVIYPVALHLDIQRNEARKQSYLESHPDEVGWVDFAPYTSTNTGGLLTIVGVVIAGSWLMVVVHRKRLRSAMLMVLPFLVVLSFAPSAHAECYGEIVDVLAAEDEEFRWCYPAGWQRDLGWGLFIQDAFDKFEEEFGITFKLRGWIDWDSTDYTGTLDELLDEAIEETNFESQVTTYDGYVIDMLMVFTGEPQEQHLGRSPPDLKALIIDGLTMAPRVRLLQHELSHQFLVKHCGNDCVMNLAKWETFQWVPDHWCGQCATTVNNNKDRFWLKPDVTVLRGTLLNPLYFEGRTSVEVDGDYIGNTPITFSALAGSWVNIQVKYEVWTSISIWRLQYYEVIYTDSTYSYNATVYYPNGWDIDVYVGSSPITVIGWYDYVGRPPSEDPPPGGGGGGGGGGNYPRSPFI